MVIITIKFKSGSKTYDYLMSNPDHNKLDPNIPLNLITGCGRSGTAYEAVTLVGCQKIDELPAHVTTCLVIGKNNLVSTCAISLARKPEEPHGQPKIVSSASFKWPRNPVDHSYIDEAARLLQLDPIERLKAIYDSKKN